MSAGRCSLAPVVALLAGAVAPVGLVGFLRVLAPGPGAQPSWPFLALLGGLSVGVAALGALRTRELLPSLAFQAVGQGGFAAIALAGGTATGRAAAIYQIGALTLSLPLVIMGTAAVLQAVRSDQLGDFARLRAVQPVVAGIALLGAASLAGVPPFPGYVARRWLVEALLRPGPYHLPLLLVVVLGSAVLAVSLFRLLNVGPLPVLSTPAPRRRSVLAPLMALAALGALLAFVPPDLALRLDGATGEDGPTGGLAPTLVVLAALSLGAALRLGELSLLPARLQAAYDLCTRALGLAVRPAAWLRKRISPDRLDAYTVVAGAVALVAAAAAFMLDNTLGRLGRSG